MAQEEILVDRPEAGILRVVLNRPDSLNAFTYSMYARLIEILRGLRHDSATRVVILTGSGKGFCSGHDLRNAGKPTTSTTRRWARPTSDAT